MYGESSGPNKRPHIEETSAPTTGRTQGRHKKSGKRGEQKQAEVLPLVGMLNETTGACEKPVSIRELLKNTKVDVSLLDLVAWSPASCKEVKRLCTRVTKKKKPKVQESQKTAPMPVPFNPQYPKAILPGFHTMFPSMPQQPVSTSSKPMETQMNPSQKHFGNAASHAPPQYFHQQNIPLQTFAAPPGPSSAQKASQMQHYPQADAESEILATTTGLPQVSSAAIAPDLHTRIISTMFRAEKAFRIPCCIWNNGVETVLPISQIQVDQGSDLNVISTGLATKLGLQLQSLDLVGFRGLTMRTADHKDTQLHHWVLLNVGVQGIWRKIRCFVSPAVTSLPTASNPSLLAPNEPLSLLLGIPWLYSVNAQLSIRHSKIEVGDPSMGETVRQVVGPELVYCHDHNLLMYPKGVLPDSVTARPHPHKTLLATVEELDLSESSSSEESEDELSDVEDPDFR